MKRTKHDRVLLTPEEARLFDMQAGLIEESGTISDGSNRRRTVRQKSITPKLRAIGFRLEELGWILDIQIGWSKE